MKTTSGSRDWYCMYCRTVYKDICQDGLNAGNVSYGLSLHFKQENVGKRKGGQAFQLVGDA